jgi:aspartate racemase
VKRIGLIGGISPESTEIYARLFNKAARARLGGEHSANFIVWHCDYGRMIALYHARDWAGYESEIVNAGEALKRAGASALMIGSNTSHITAEGLQRATGVPVIHIVDALVLAMRRAGVKRPLLLGTPVVMAEGSYYRRTLAERFSGLAVVPGADDQRDIGGIIFDELCLGVVAEASRARLLEVIRSHKEADGVILGCTELSMILKAGDCAAPVFDTTALHAEAGMRFAFGEEP